MSDEQKSNDLSKNGPVTHVAQVVHHGDKLVLPEGMSIKDAKDLLDRREKYLQEQVRLVENFPVFPWDGAYGLDKVLTAMYGWTPMEAIQTMFGKQPPALITIDIDHDKKAQVPWGKFSLPNVKGELKTDSNFIDGRLCFTINAVVTREGEATVMRLFNELREYLKANSIYRGKAIRLRLSDDNGERLAMPEPKFMRVDDITREALIYSEALERSVETNLFTPIVRCKELAENGIPIKRGVLLGGPFGTGKTLAAKMAARLAVENGLTYVYLPRADEFADGVAFALQYQSPACVLFCEDIDRAMDGERDEDMDDILNILDGIDSKNGNLIAVLTTNNLVGINQAMLRPGRLDAVLEVLPPDAGAVERLIRYYGGTTIAKTMDLSRIGAALAGNIPAVIAEVVKRAKLAQLRLNPVGQKVERLTEEALLESAETMDRQLGLLNRKDETPKVTIDSLVREAIAEVTGMDTGTAERVREIHNRVC